MKQASVEHVKSVAGILLLGLGILFLRAELNQTVTHIHNLITNVPNGTLPVALLDEAQHSWQTSGADSRRVLQHVAQQVLVSAWPLLLVSIGMGLSKEVRP